MSDDNQKSGDVIEFPGDSRKPRGYSLNDVRDVRRQAALIYNEYKRGVQDDWDAKNVTAVTGLLSLLHKLVVDQAMQERLEDLEAKVNSLAKRA